MVTSLHHTSLQFDEPIPLLLLRHADGQRTRGELWEILQTAAEHNDFGLMDEEGKPLAAGEKRDDILHHALEISLERFEEFALLE